MALEYQVDVKILLDIYEKRITELEREIIMQRARAEALEHIIKEHEQEHTHND